MTTHKVTAAQRWFVGLFAVVVGLAEPARAEPPEGAAKTKKAKKPKKPKKRTGGEVGLTVLSQGKKDLTRTEKELEFDLDLRPKLVGKVGFGKHDLALTYNPRLVLPLAGPRSGDFDHLHRIRFDWKGKFGTVGLKLRQDVEVGLRDFKSTVPAIDSGVPELPDDTAGDDASAEVSDEVTDEGAADEVSTDEAELAEESDGEPVEEGDVPEEGGEEPPEDVELPTEEQLDDRLTLIEQVFVLKTATDLGLDFELAKGASLGVGFKFTRSGAVDERAQTAFPERLNPVAKVGAKIAMGKRFKLLPSIDYEYSTYSTSAESMVGAATVGVQMSLFGKSKATVRGGVAGTHFTTKTLEQAYLAPFLALDLVFAMRPKGHQVDLTLGTALKPYTSGASGVVTPRVGGTFGAAYKGKSGVFVKAATSIISNTTPQEYDPQGYTVIVDGKLGWALSPYFSVDVGTQFQRSQKPDRKGKSFDPDDRLQFFLTLTGGSGFLP